MQVATAQLILKRWTDFERSIQVLYLVLYKWLNDPRKWRQIAPTVTAPTNHLNDLFRRYQKHLELATSEFVRRLVLTFLSYIVTVNDTTYYFSASLHLCSALIVYIENLKDLEDDVIYDEHLHDAHLSQTVSNAVIYMEGLNKLTK